MSDPCTRHLPTRGPFGPGGPDSAASGVKVRNVVGGITGWAAAGLPVVRDDGSPGAIA